MSGTSPDAHYAAYDEALERLAPYGPDLAWGFTDHAPMVAEALCALGRGDAVGPWLDAHAEGWVARPRPTDPVRADAWREALGRPERWADWSALFEAEIAERGWRPALAAWLPRLLPGLAAAAGHGAIRTGHATRALALGDGPLRRGELASALGYWAATWQALPVAEGSTHRPRTAAAALESVPRLEGRRPATRSIVEALELLDGFPAFAPVIHDLDTERAPETVLADLAETFARVLLANAKDTLGAIVFTHGVTGVAALRALAPHLDDAALPDALRYAWQTGAALYASYATSPPARDEPGAPAEDPESLVERAIASGDDHAIKLTEACVSEHARHAAPVHLAAAKRGIERLSWSPARDGF